MLFALARRRQLAVRVPAQQCISMSTSPPTSPSRDHQDKHKDAGGAAPLVQGRSEETNADSEEGAKEKKRWGQQLAWLNSILEPALNFYHRALPSGSSEGSSGPASTRSLVDIAASLHRSNYGIQQWGLGDFTLGLYLLSLRHAAEGAVEHLEGDQVVSDDLVEDLIYYVELAKGAYMKNEAALARISMLRESSIVKFVDKASVMRPAHYIAIDHRTRLVILGIRGTQSIHDLITDLAQHTEEEIFEDGNVHFGTAEAARWFYHNELNTLRTCLKQNAGYGLRIVGHSLGGATASLLAMMLHKKAFELLGVHAQQIAAVGVATPPCVTRNLAIECSDYVATLALQFDVIPRISAGALERLRDEILLVDWSNILKDEENRTGLLDLVASAVQAISSVQEAARRYAVYAKLKTISEDSGKDREKQEISTSAATNVETPPKPPVAKITRTINERDELYAPGTLYHLCGRPSSKPKERETANSNNQGCTLWRVKRDVRFSRILLSGSILSDHKCDSHYYALRDVLKGLPRSASRQSVFHTASA